MSSDIILAVVSGSFAILAAIIACCQHIFKSIYVYVNIDLVNAFYWLLVGIRYRTLS